MNYADILTPAQIFGLAAFGLDATAFALKNDRAQLSLRSVGCLTWVAHYYLLGKMVPAFFLCLDFIRYFSANWVRARPALTWPAIIFFAASYITAGLLLQNAAIDFLPTVTAVAACYCTYALRGIPMRVGFFFIMSSWMTYNFMVHSIGGVLNDAVVVLINATTIYRMIRDERKTA